MANNEIDKLKEEKEELEHEVFEQKLKGVKGQLVAMGDMLHNRMDSIEEKNEIQFGHITDRFDNQQEALKKIMSIGEKTFSQTKQTNGRVTELEKDKIEADLKAEQLEKEVEKISKNTRMVRFMHKYPKVTVIGLIVAYLFTIREIRDVVFGNFGDLLKLIF
jgi:Ni,Fe-hydrogenase I large subunit